MLVLELVAESCTNIGLEAIELHDTSVARDDLQLMASRCSTPLRAEKFCFVEGERLATLSLWLPAESLLGKTAFTRLARKVKMDIIK